MLARRDEIIVGIVILCFGVLLLTVLIPNYVEVPRRVRLLALAPYFWPNIIGALLVLCGGLLAVRAYFAPPTPPEQTESLAISQPEALRLAGTLLLLVATLFALPRLGMVWTTMITFVAMVLLTGGKRLVWAIVVAVLLPLVLYIFFYKIAGVAIPQGRFVRLP